jgi:alcohol dehydrogenase YqhD (iron-dependent ADH family)
MTCIHLARLEGRRNASRTTTVRANKQLTHLSPETTKSLNSTPRVAGPTHHFWHVMREYLRLNDATTKDRHSPTCPMIMLYKVEPKCLRDEKKYM